MTDDHALLLVALSCAGLGFLMSGLALLMGRNLSLSVRLAIMTGTSGAATGLAVSVVDWNHALITGLILSLGTLVYLLFITRFASVATQQLAQRPVLSALGVCFVGLVLTLGSFLWYDHQDQKILDDQMMMFSRATDHPILMNSDQLHAQTDRGTQIRLRTPAEPRDAATSKMNEQNVISSHTWNGMLLRNSHASDITNCHGWIFSGGRYWIEGNLVESILADNGYVLVDRPRPGDLVVYRDEHSIISHTAIVRYVTDGLPVLVEGKWGSMGTYIHRVHESVYGMNFQYYRSQRPGHILNGIESPGSEPRATAVPGQP